MALLLRSTARLATPVVAVALVAVGCLVLAIDAAGAQTATSVAPTAVPAENPSSTAAGLVFFGVSGAIIVGALVLYLRNRRPRSPAQSER